ncbi:hypothetical protein [Deinococcus aquaticus]
MRTVLLVYGVLATPVVLAWASFILSGRHPLREEAARTAQENESC